MSLTYRVLVVDDYELWRRHVRSALHGDPRWRIVGEASDGLEAIQEARVLKPDLILLDVGLPAMTGIEAARRILTLEPGARIVFLSEHRSWDVVEAALATRAHGYIVKSDVGGDLPSALQAIVDGRRFISASVVEPALRRATHEHFRVAHRHEAVFHSDEASLLEEYARCAGSALASGHAVLLAASPSRLDRIGRLLQARGLDSDRVVVEGRYTPLDVTAMLASFLTEGVFDEARFLSAATSLLMKAGSAAMGKELRIAVCGDGHRPSGGKVKRTRPCGSSSSGTNSPGPTT
jgi:DNA-binding NarL/FixJ family response regulator